MFSVPNLANSATENKICWSNDYVGGFLLSLLLVLSLLFYSVLFQFCLSLLLLLFSTTLSILLLQTKNEKLINMMIFLEPF